MMEPLQNDTADQPDVAPEAPSDPALADATETLERAIDSTSGGRQTADRVARQEAPAPTAPAPPRPPRMDSYRRMQEAKQDGFYKRMREESARRQELEAYRRETQGTVEKQADLNRMMLEYLKGQRPDGPPPPDALDPKFGEWLRGQMTAQNQEAFKPLLDWVQAQQRQQEEAQQRQQEQQQHEQLAAGIASTFQQHQAAYEQELPEIAHGFTERFQTTRNVLADVFAEMGYPQDLAQNMADVHLFQVGDHAVRQGGNGAAAIDAFQAALFRRFGYEPIEPGDDPAAVWGDGNGNGQGYPPPQAPPPTETDRLAAVQRRARPAGSAAPRVASRAEQQRSELTDLVRGGVTDLRQLRAAALRDAGGNMKEAAVALQRAASGM